MLDILQNFPVKDGHVFPFLFYFRTRNGNIHKKYYS